ncbi:MAG: hypothetical protein PHT25_03040 [Bacteroidales bacterium]|nr:hypothetical protein [Bacteroidales bacterium]
MKHFIFALCAALLLFSCQKDESRDTSFSAVYGSWEKVEEKYLITTNQDYNFLDLYDSQWTGTLTINGYEVDFGDLRFYFSNTGSTRLASNVISFTFGVQNIQINYNNKVYLLTKPFTFDKATGQFIVSNRQAADLTGGEQISINLNIQAQTRLLQRGVEYKISTVGYSDMPYTQLNFTEKGDLNGTLLWQGDIACDLTGEWYVKSNILIMKYKANFASLDGEQREFTLPVAKGDSLIFTKSDNNIVYNESNMNIPRSAIQNLKLRTAFIKE